MPFPRPRISCPRVLADWFPGPHCSHGWHHWAWPIQDRNTRPLQPRVEAILARRHSSSKILDDGSTTISGPNGYSDKRAAAILRDLIQRKISQSPKLTMTGNAGLGNGYPLHYSMHELQIEITEYLQAVFYPEAESLDESLHFVQFLARLTAAGFGGGMPRIGFQIMRKDLEETQNDDPFESFFVMCAASWVILARRTLYAEVVEAPSELYAGPRLGKELWTFWKKRLRELEESGDKLAQAKAALGSAVRVVDQDLWKRKG